MKRSKPGKLLVILFVLSVLFTVMSIVLKNTLIINFGIRKYRSLNMFLFCITAVAGIAALVLYIPVIIHNLKLSDFFPHSNRKRQGEDSSDTARPYENGKFHNSILQDVLQQYRIQWKSQSVLIYELSNQLQKMDNLQERLHRLLVNNDVSILSDTEDVLDQVEQYLCRNIYNCINYMEVYDPGSPSDTDAMHNVMDITVQKNDEKLKNTQEFMLALTEYINRQNGADNDTSMLDTYKNTILQSLTETEEKK